MEIFRELNNRYVAAWMKAQRISQVIFPCFEVIYIIGACLTVLSLYFTQKIKTDQHG